MNAVMKVIPTIAFSALALSISPIIIDAATLTVGTNGAYQTISDAIYEARDGDTISVDAGTYKENLVIDKSLKLIGLNGACIDGSLTGNVITVAADDVQIRGFEIIRSGNDMMRSDAGIRIQGDRAIVSGNTLRDNLFGVYLGGSDYSLIEGNTIEGRREKGMGDRGPGVQLFDSNHNVVRGNEIYWVRDGVYFDHADFNRVDENKLHNLRYGVHYMSCDDNTFERNEFRDSMAGAAIMYTKRVTFNDNLILNIREGYSAYGLLLKDAEDCVAARNVIINCATGIFSEGSNRNKLMNNLVAYCDVGMMLFASSTDNQFGLNDFVGNIADLHTVGRSVADFSPAGYGNYYSSYTGYDIDGDGKGDVTHKLQDVFEYLEGSHPILRLYLSSGAADAMVLAEKTFPLIDGANLEDAYPSIKPVSGIKLADFSDVRFRPNSAWLVSIIALLTTVASTFACMRLSK